MVYRSLLHTQKTAQKGEFMKNRLILLFFTVCVICSVSSCHSAPPNSGYFSYRATLFRAEIEGTLYGTSFSAEIGQTEHTEEASIYIKYLSPKALCGITVYKFPDGTCCLERGKASVPTDADAIGGLLLPISFLFEEDEILRVQKIDGNTALSLPHDATLLLSDTFMPLSIHSSNLECFTVWWETQTTK